MKKLLLLLLCFTLMLSACGAPEAAPQQTEAATQEAAQEITFDSLLFETVMPLSYATGFTVSYSQEGYKLLTIGEDQTYLVVGENLPVPTGVPADVTVLQQPLDQIYLVATAAMDHFVKLNALDTIILSSQKKDSWYLPEARQAMEEGKITYAGKYSAPDYETILASGCDLVIENAMIYHAPEVLEKLRGLGLPVLVELSSYESHPLGRMEWIKLFGALVNKEAEASAYFDNMMESLTPVLNQEPTGKTVSFFYITTSGGINVRRSSDYVSSAIRLAGCENIVFGEDQADLGTSTMTVQMEAFYEGARDADILIYNSIVEGELDSLDALLAKMPTLKDFKAVKEGNVWCLSKNFYQETMSLGEFILDVNTAATGSGGQMRYLKRLQ